MFVAGSVDSAVDDGGWESTWRRNAFTWVSIKVSRSGSSVYGYLSVK